jgi:hypothetical protein
MKKINDFDLAVMAEIIELLNQKPLTKEELEQVLVKKDYNT